MNLYKVAWVHNGHPHSVIGLAESATEASAYVKSFDTEADRQEAAEAKPAKHRAPAETSQEPEKFYTFQIGEVSELYKDVCLLGASGKLVSWKPGHQSPEAKAEEATQAREDRAEKRAVLADQKADLAEQKAEHKAATQHSKR